MNGYYSNDILSLSLWSACRELLGDGSPSPLLQGPRAWTGCCCGFELSRLECRRELQTFLRTAERAGHISSSMATMEVFSRFSLKSFVLYWIIGMVLRYAGLAIYRVYFHPLAEIPGPFWAKVTYLYSFKQNVSGPGSRFYLHIEKLHEKYGNEPKRSYP